MRFLEAKGREWIAIEPEQELIRSLAEKAGFVCDIVEDSRRLILEIEPASANEPLLLFDAAEPANLGWFSRCRFYVDAVSGKVLQTPLVLANCRDAEGRLLHKLRVAVEKEVPVGFRLPGRRTVDVQMVYMLLENLLQALFDGGVAICGTGGVVPLTGRPPQTPHN